MQELSGTVRKVALTVVAISIAALALSEIAVRFPFVWPIFPEWVMKFVVTKLEPRGQEAVAEAEFLGFWLVCFLVLTSCAAVALAFQLHRRRRSSHSPCPQASSQDLVAIDQISP